MKKLKAYLTGSELTQAEFAKAIGVSQPTISDWLNGEVTPSVENLILISRHTGISIDDLVRDFAKEVA